MTCFVKIFASSAFYPIVAAPKGAQSNCCRCLRLILVPASTPFFRLAPIKLHTLVFQAEKGSEGTMDVPSLLRWKNLVRLELICISFRFLLDDGNAICLPVEELVLIECEYAEAYLLPKGHAFWGLKKLHIEEAVQESRLPAYLDGLCQDAMSICSLCIGRTLRRPYLEQVSGNSKYLAQCMAVSSDRWRKSFCIGTAISEFSRYTNSELRVWVRM